MNWRIQIQYSFSWICEKMCDFRTLSFSTRQSFPALKSFWQLFSSSFSLASPLLKLLVVCSLDFTALSFFILFSRWHEEGCLSLHSIYTRTSTFVCMWLDACFVNLYHECAFVKALTMGTLTRGFQLLWHQTLIVIMDSYPFPWFSLSLSLVDGLVKRLEELERTAELYKGK